MPGHVGSEVKRNSVRLVGRDLQILEAIGAVRYATSQQIMRLYFSNLKVAQRRLRVLVQAGMLERFRISDEHHAGFHRWFYRLTRRGFNLASKACKAQPGPVTLQKRAPSSTSFIAHHQLTTDFRIWIREACLRMEPQWSYSFLSSYSEIRWMGRRRRLVALDVPGSERLLIPDGVFRIESPDGYSALFFLEIDRSTEPLRGRHRSSIKHKLELYSRAFDFALEEYFRKHLGSSEDGFRVICLVPEPRRAIGFLEIARQVDLAPLVWVATHDILEQRGDLSAEVWQTEVGGHQCSLLD